MAEAPRDPPDMLGIAGKAAPLAPAVCDLGSRVAEEVEEAIVETDLSWKSALDRLDSFLGDIGPDAQQVRVLSDGDRGHLAFSSRSLCAPLHGIF